MKALISSVYSIFGGTPWVEKNSYSGGFLMSIKPEYLTLDNLLQKKLFRIPNYQRTYSWETKQREDLFGDIRKLKSYKKDRHHFMATIVCLKTNIGEEIGTDEYALLDVVDGQQRLTTLIILLKALSKALSKGEEVHRNEAEGLDKLLVKVTDKRLILLQTNHDSSFTFHDYLVNGIVPNSQKVKTLADRNLVKAFEECENFVQEWEKQDNLLELLKMLKNRLDFIFYVLEDEGSVYTVFEVLNSRGLEVDWLDKCKSMLMGIAYEKFEKEISTEKIQELHKYWSKIYQTIGLREVPGREILTFAATLWHEDKLSRALSPEASINIFREFCLETPTALIDVSKWLLDVARNLEELYKNPRRKAVTEISQARLLAVAILMADTLSDEERKEALEQWERVTFRIFGLFRKDSRTKVGDFTRLAHEVIKGMSKEEIIEGLIEIGSDHPIKDAVEQLRGNDCYTGWEQELRYFFFRYEEYLSQKDKGTVSEELWEQIWLSSPSTTIEHIHPQTLTKMAWRGKLGKAKDREKYINNLGNLMILPPKINSKANAKSFKEKKEIYYENYLRLMVDILQKSDWNKETIEERENNLINWALIAWSDLY